MEKIKQILSKLTLKHYLGIGVGVIVLYLVYSFVFKVGMFTESDGIELIPKNTFAVAVVSVGDIIDKADIEDLLELDLDIVEDMLEMKEDAIKELEDDNELLASILKDPADIGIDIDQDIFIYGVVEDMKKEEMYLCVSGGVDDEDRLKEILEEIKDMMPNDDYEDDDKDDYRSNKFYFDISEEDDYNIAITYNKQTNTNRYNDSTEIYYYDVMALAWDNDKFLVITGIDKYRWDNEEVDNLEDEVEKLFNLESKDKLTSVSSFDDFYDNKTDLCAWASPEGLKLDFMPGFSKMILSVVGLRPKDIKECSASVFCNFGDGEVSVKAAFYPSEGVREELQKRSEISTSEFSVELTTTFDDSGDNTIHVLLRSLLTLADQFMPSGDIFEFEELLDDFGGGGEESTKEATKSIKVEKSYRDYDRKEDDAKAVSKPVYPSDDKGAADDYNEKRSYDDYYE